MVPAAQKSISCAVHCHLCYDSSLSDHPSSASVWQYTGIMGPSSLASPMGALNGGRKNPPLAIGQMVVAKAALCWRILIRWGNYTRAAERETETDKRKIGRRQMGFFLPLPLRSVRIEQESDQASALLWTCCNNEPASLKLFNAFQFICFSHGKKFWFVL